MKRQNKGLVNSFKNTNRKTEHTNDNQREYLYLYTRVFDTVKQAKKRQFTDSFTVFLITLILNKLFSPVEATLTHQITMGFFILLREVQCPPDGLRSCGGFLSRLQNNNCSKNLFFISQFAAQQEMKIKSKKNPVYDLLLLHYFPTVEAMFTRICQLL